MPVVSTTNTIDSIHGLLRAEAGATYEISKAWAEKWVEEEGLRGDVWRILMSEW